MYYAVNPIAPDWLPSLVCEIDALQSVHEGQKIYLHALLDGVADEPLIARYRQYNPAGLSLYDDTALQAYGTAAPHLFPVPTGPGLPLWWLTPLVANCSGKAMLSIIASPLDGTALRRHLRPYLICISDDSTTWHLRWADTRVLPALLDNLTTPRREHLLSPMYRWWSVRRDGALTSWQGGANPAPPPAGFERLPINDAAFARLMDGADADAVLADVFEVRASLFKGKDQARCHARMAHHLAIATAHGIEAAGARRHFGMLVMLLADDFVLHPAMRDMLRNIRNGADYMAEHDALPDSFWQATSVAPGAS